jgi:nucleotidyltransferase AbiEii toxin of type IV toxin-antitoxin system
MIDIYDELRRLITMLDERKVDYALCGGMAMAIHQRPRMTIDIDLLIQAESLDKVMAVASTLGYEIRGKDLSFANGAVEIRRVSKIDPESGDLLSLDFLLVTPPIRMVWDSRIESEWEGGKLSVVSRTGLIALKQLRSSGQDLDDIKVLEEGRRDDQS